MSTKISSFLKQHPLLTGYIQKGLINFNALARYIKEENTQIGGTISLAALGMELRRYISKLPRTLVPTVHFSKYALQLVVRTNINEIVFNKNPENRKVCTNLLNKISQTKYFVSIVEGEREIVVMTDYPLKGFLKDKGFIKNVTYSTEALGFVSINFPVELRLVPGVYNIITSNLAEANISIHSFHTIGGEILILVKNKDLSQTQQILQDLLNSSTS